MIQIVSVIICQDCIMINMHAFLGNYKDRLELACVTFSLRHFLHSYSCLVLFYSPDKLIKWVSLIQKSDFGESDLVDQGAVIRIRRFPVQTPLGAQPSLGAQPPYEAPSDPLVENVKTQWLTSGECGYPFNNDPKVAVGQQNSSQKSSHWRSAIKKVFLKTLQNLLENICVRKLLFKKSCRRNSGELWWGFNTGAFLWILQNF